MKIAIIFDMIYPFNIGGIEIRNHEFAKRLVKAGHEVHLFGVKLWKGQSIQMVTVTGGLKVLN